MSGVRKELEGLFVGISSGAAMAAALPVARRVREGVIVTVFPDGGGKYLGADIFTWKPDE